MNQISNNSTKKPSKTTAFFICVIIAALLWLFNALNSAYTVAINCNVNFINVPKSKIPLQALPTKINLQVASNGLKLLLMQVTKEKNITIDFNNLSSNANATKYAIGTSNLSLGNALGNKVKINSINPDTLVFIEPKGFQKNVIVKLETRINCKRGYGFEIENVSPKFITVYGQKELVASIDTIYSQVLAINQVSLDCNGVLNLISPNSNLILSESVLNYSIKVNKLIEKSIELPLSLMNEEGYKSVNIFPNKVKLTYTTLQNQVVDNDENLFKAKVNIGKSSKHQVVLVTKPGYVNVIKIDPEQVELVLMKK